MKVPVAAYRLLLEVAEAHRGLCAEEIRLLERYRRSLGITRAQILEETQTPVTERMIEGSQREREAALLAMARVALVDGRLSPLERARILEVAGRMGVGRVQIANVLHRAEDEHAERASKLGHVHRGRVVVIAGVVAIVALVAHAAVRVGSPASAAESLQAIAAEHDDALLFIHVAYDLVRDGERREFGGTGTGFFASPDGRIVTNKHVVQPWKFLASAVRLLDEGWELDVESIHHSAWPVGARVRGSVGDLAHEHAFTTRDGSLELVAAAPDRWVRGRRLLPDGGRHPGRYHALDENDLAVLQARPRGRVEHIPLAESSESVRPLDPIVVLGFPRGLSLFEGHSVVSSPCPGAVRKIEETLLLDAPIYPGNSGGPVLGPSGEVVGVAARRFSGEESLGRCIRVRHVRALVDSVR